MFIGAIQAFIFALLTIMYFGMAMSQGRATEDPGTDRRTLDSQQFSINKGEEQWQQNN